MRTVTFKTLYRGLIRRWGRDPDSVSLSAAEEERLAEIIEQACKEGVEARWWPDCLRVERRQYRADYAAGTAYSAGDEVYYLATDKYYQALQSTTGNAPADSDGDENSEYWAESDTSYDAADYSATTAYAIGDQVYYETTDRYYQCIQAGTGNAPNDTSYWGVLTDFEAYIAFDQTWESNEIGAVQERWCIYRDNPDLHGEHHNRVMGRVERQHDRIVVTSPSIPTRPYVRYRIRPPRLTRVDYEAGAGYTAGDVVYSDTTGDAYVCIAAGTGNAPPDTDYWTRQEIPEFLQEYILLRGAGALRSEEDGRYETMSQAMREMDRLEDVYLYGEQTEEPAEVVV
jgi:hypothetical protein